MASKKKVMCSNFQLGLGATDSCEVTYKQRKEFIFTVGIKTQLTSSSDKDVITECKQKCTEKDDCLSFILERAWGGGQTCVASTSSAAIAPNGLKSAPGSGAAYFEKSCLGEFVY